MLSLAMAKCLKLKDKFMDISILFNWPPDKDSARVSLAGPTIDDTGHEFRVGIIKKSEKDKIYWLKPGWVDAKNIHEIKFDMRIGEKVVVEKKKKGGEEILTRNMWDIEEKWPEKAYGETSVSIRWSFH